MQAYKTWERRREGLLPLAEVSPHLLIRDTDFVSEMSIRSKGHPAPVKVYFYYAELYYYGRPYHVWTMKAIDGPTHSIPEGVQWEMIKYQPREAGKADTLDALLHGITKQIGAWLLL